ncbi:class I SAM-dependent methyltransferase [Profundibacter sp.]|uniref:class I SAM-dependent methyltransferase n=1 Tax=Profundibacter sp. TaxID=3101071 RepID=UPI003D144C43
MDNDRAVAVAANRRAWNESAARHKAGERWAQLVQDVSRPDFSSFDNTMTDALRRIDLRGKSVVQVGCNNGREVLSLASFGAKHCLGIDQAEEFIAQANELNRIAGQDCRFLRADIYDLPADVPQDFDLVLVTIGVLNWMPDLAGFFQAVAGLLRQGGQVLIYETHPFLEMFEPIADNPYQLANSYFREHPFIDTDPIVYDGVKDGKVTPSYWYIHKISDVLNGCIAAGLQIVRFDEFPHSNREVEYDCYEGQAAQLPMCYLLEARKPG